MRHRGWRAVYVASVITAVEDSVVGNGKEILPDSGMLETEEWPEEAPVQKQPINDEQKWQAVQVRDAAMDGHFVYGVVSTGVFCHPSCPSRQALRENVRFFERADQAQEAGFRACQRCLSDELTPAGRRASLVEHACRLLDDDHSRSMSDVAEALGIGRQRLARVFRQTTGLTPKQWQLARRRENLIDQTLNAPRVTDAMFDAGYDSATRFYADARDRLGMSPTHLRAGAKGEVMRYALAPSVLGRLLVAWTDKGLCAVELSPQDVDDADDAWFESRLGARFSRAVITRDDQAGADLVSAVVSRIKEPSEATGLTLDVRGTAFQQRVWSALMRIPVGETASYAEVADAIGSPRSHRAVATACAANPLAVVVPCHRVVRADGSLSGYRWGTDRKQALLIAERGVHAAPGENQISSTDKD